MEDTSADHVIDDSGGFSDCSALETHVCHFSYEFGGCDVHVFAVVVVEFGAIDHRSTFRHRGGSFKDGIVRDAWCCLAVCHRAASWSCHDNVFWIEMENLVSTIASILFECRTESVLGIHRSDRQA